jgi:hypothetical protein
LEHFSSKIGRKRQSNSATLICFRARAPRAHDVAALLAPGRVGMPPYQPYAHAEAGPRPVGIAPRPAPPVHDVGGPLDRPRDPSHWSGGGTALRHWRADAAPPPLRRTPTMPQPTPRPGCVGVQGSTPHRLVLTYKGRRLLPRASTRAAAPPLAPPRCAQCSVHL